MSDIEGRLDHEKEWPHGWDGERGHPPTLSWVWVVVIGLVVSCLMGSCEAAMADVSEVVLETIALESANQTIFGQALVANVIRTRAQIGQTSPQSVVMRPKAFSAWNDRNRARKWLKRHFNHQTRQNCLLAWEMSKSMPYKLTHYHTKVVKPYWAKGHKPVIVEGNHAFYEGIK